MSCPICDKPTDKAYRPFCSRRCTDVDLGRWMTESYRIPSNEEPDAEQGPDTIPKSPLN